METWKPRILITQQQKQNILFFSRMFNIHPITCYLIYARGHRTQESIRHFLYPSFNHFSSLYSLKDMNKGLERVMKAIKNNEIIGIFGDYDADGITSTSMMNKALRFFGVNSVPMIPLRDEGYGLSKLAVDRFKAENVSLILTLDNGSSCFDEIAYANEKGIDTVIIDHHDILKAYPPAVAFINPKRNDDTSHLDYLSGAGVTLRFIEGLFDKSFLPWHFYMQEYIELATIGTICDMVPLVDDNRLLCNLGMKKMNLNPTSSLKLLKQWLKLPLIDSGSISFNIGPLINGFGRYDNPNLLIPFLSFNEDSDWLERKCLSLNQSRKRTSYEQTLLADSIVSTNKLMNNDILHIHGDFHDGILGVIASKFSKKYKKPTLVSSFSGKGSARSIPNSNYSIVELLKQHEDYFSKYGGHQAAAGFTFNPSSIELFHKKVTSVRLEPKLLEQIVLYDMKLPIHQFTTNLYEELSFLEPFGMGNPKPVFQHTNASFNNIEYFGKFDTHLKCSLDNAALFSFFADASDIAKLSFDSFDVLYSPLNAKEYTIESLRSNKKAPFPFVI